MFLKLLRDKFSSRYTKRASISFCIKRHHWSLKLRSISSGSALESLPLWKSKRCIVNKDFFIETLTCVRTFTLRRIRSHFQLPVSVWFIIDMSCYNFFLITLLYNIFKNHGRDVEDVCHECILAVKRLCTMEARVTHAYRCVRIVQINRLHILIVFKIKHERNCNMGHYERACEHTLKRVNTILQSS